MTGGVRGVGAGISAVFAGQGATVVTCARRPVDGIAVRVPRLRRPRRRVGQGADRRDRRRPRSPRRRGQQRGRLALRAGRRCVGEVQHQDHRAQSAWSAVGFAACQRRDADAGLTAGRSSTSPASAAAGRPRAPPRTARPRPASRASPPRWPSSGRPKVRVNSVVVGMVETEQSELFYGDADSIAAISKNVPLGRLAKPERHRLGHGVPRLRRGVLHQWCVTGGAWWRRTAALPVDHHCESNKRRQQIWDCSTVAWSS